MTTRIAAALITTLFAASLAACSPVVSTPVGAAARGTAVADAGRASAEASFTGDPARLVQEKCTICHPIERVTRAQKDWDGWSRALDHMKRNGAPLTGPEREAIVEYLTNRR